MSDCLIDKVRCQKFQPFTKLQLTDDERQRKLTPACSANLLRLQCINNNPDNYLSSARRKTDQKLAAGDIPIQQKIRHIKMPHRTETQCDGETIRKLDKECSPHKCMRLGLRAHGCMFMG